MCVLVGVGVGVGVCVFACMWACVRAGVSVYNPAWALDLDVMRAFRAKRASTGFCQGGSREAALARADWDTAGGTGVTDGRRRCSRWSGSKSWGREEAPEPCGEGAPMPTEEDRVAPVETRLGCWVGDRHKQIKCLSLF